MRLATVIAGNLGRVIGWAMILLGIALILGINVWIFQGGFIGGLWMIFIGWFLSNNADNAMREQNVHEKLKGVLVRDVMDRYPECVSPNTSIERIVNESFIQRGRRAFQFERKRFAVLLLLAISGDPKNKWQQQCFEVMTRHL